MWNYPIFKFINTNVNIRNERNEREKNVEKLVGVYF